MKICKVVGNVWATKKEKSLEGFKLMIVVSRDAQSNLNHGESFVAADLVGAGIGEDVLIVTGSVARFASNKEHSVIDAAIVGIIDSMEEVEV